MTLDPLGEARMMLPELSGKAMSLKAEVEAFMDEHVYPNEHELLTPRGPDGRWAAGFAAWAAILRVLPRLAMTTLDTTDCAIDRLIVDDPDRAEKFYTDVFGWTFLRYDGAPEYYGMATTGDDDKPGINGALFKRGDIAETTLTMGVDSIEETIGKVKEKGGKVLQDKTAIPTMGWFATCVDTEGNKFGLFVNDSTVA